MIHDHVGAIVELLEDALQTWESGTMDGVAVYDAVVPAHPTFPYVAVWSMLHPTDSVDPALCPDYAGDALEARVWTTCVGVTAESARIVQANVRAALSGVIPDVDGRACWPLRVVDSQPLIEDRDVTVPGFGTHPLYVVDVWRVGSNPDPTHSS